MNGRDWTPRQQAKYEQKLRLQAAQLYDLQKAVQEFFAILDITEDSEMTGRDFHPTTIRSCRVMDGQRLESILSHMRALSQTNTQT